MVTATNLSLLRANAETSHSVRYDLVVVVISIMGSGEKFSHGMVRSRKLPLSGPSDEWIDILTKYQSLSLRELKYRDINGYSRYGLYKLYN